MKKLFGLLAVFLAFLLVAFIALAMFPPTELALRMLAANLRNQTGMDLKIAGPKSLRLHPQLAFRWPDVSFRAENITLSSSAASGGKPLATAQMLQVNTSLWGAVRGHRVDRVMLTNPTVDLEIGKDGFPVGIDMPQKRTASAAPKGEPYSLVVLEMTGASIHYRDQRTGLDARLERTRATLRDVHFDRFGEALVNAGAVTVNAPGQIGLVEIADLDATVSGFTDGRVREASGTGSSMKWQDAGKLNIVEAQKFTANGRALDANGAETLTLTAAGASWREPTGRALQTSNVQANIAALRAQGTGATDLKAGQLSWRETSGDTIEAANFAASTTSLRPEGLSAVNLKADTMNWRDTAGRSFLARDLFGTAKTLKPGRAEDVTLRSVRASYGDTKRSGSPTGGLAFDQVSFITPLLAPGTPVSGDIAFQWNKEQVTGKLNLPTPEALSAASIPANLSLTNSRGSIDFDGALDTATGNIKGRTRAATTSVDALARWLAMDVPATLKGPVNLVGNIEASGTRVSLSNGTIAHGANTVTGAFAVDLGGVRPRLSGRIAADKFDADTYLGLQPVKPKPQTQPKPQSASRPEIIEPEVPLSDVFKSYMRAMIDAPVKRGGTMEIPDLTADQLIPPRSRAKPKPGSFTWSDEKFDLSALRNVDLDVEWSVKQLDVRGMQLNVPQLKTVLNAGTLTLEGRDLGTKDGKLSGKAEIDARSAVPNISATLKGEGVDLYALSAALGMTPVIDGDTAIEATVNSRGNSQKQLVEALSGNVKTNMAEGHVLGYDFGNITLATLFRWATGNREYDPERRTPVSGLRADLNIEKGVVSESQVVMGGPLLGLQADGNIGLIDQRIDYRGRARIGSIIRSMPFKFYGDWSGPTFQPDISLASVFSRSAPGEPSMSDIIAAADLKEDAELAFLIGRVLQKAGPSGLDPATANFLQLLQNKALGKP